MLVDSEELLVEVCGSRGDFVDELNAGLVVLEGSGGAVEFVVDLCGLPAFLADEWPGVVVIPAVAMNG